MNRRDRKRRGLREGYWRDTPLERMTRIEWESLCDGCGKCCMLKLEDEETHGRVEYTNIACRLFDDEDCRCSNYAMRQILVSGCVILTPETLAESKAWMPKTCAYRLLAEGADLPEWHPLRTKDPESVHAAGISMRCATIPEYEVDEEDWFYHVIAEEV